MRVLEQWEPSRVLYYFEEICSIPHGSGNTDKISEYLADFAKEHNLEYGKDLMNNVLIRKPATPGYENAPGVLLQGHMDMVCEKRQDVVFDFEKDGLNLGVKDGFLHANGTTLGGDDGIAIAYALALLESDAYEHPALEVLITVDEEIGLLGAAGFDCSAIKSRMLINLDSEEEGILWAGCAGGMTFASHIPVQYTEKTGRRLEIHLGGLQGGHSGAEIDKGRASAAILMGRFLYELKERVDFALSGYSSGEKDNAIPRIADASIVVEEDQAALVKEYAELFVEHITREYAGIEQGVTISVQEGENEETQVLHPGSLARVIFFLRNVPYGVQKMSGTIPGLVETSMNPGILRLTEEELVVTSSIRSSVGSAKEELAGKVQFLTEFLGGDYEISGSYPAWEYNEVSPLRDVMVDVYKKLYHEEPKVAVIHAGLECGLFYENLPGLDAVSIGPNMKDIHTSEEQLDLASTKRVWEYLLCVLKEIK
ncbi:MAG: aminoacyl-histidine dipeptidase [Eubacteriales bacterium]|nr:aminoacyl-histidine dipeptidase [Eubacteriales bacterium]